MGNQTVINDSSLVYYTVVVVHTIGLKCYICKITVRKAFCTIKEVSKSSISNESWSSVKARLKFRRTLFRLHTYCVPFSLLSDRERSFFQLGLHIFCLPATSMDICPCSTFFQPLLSCYLSFYCSNNC